MPSVFRRVARLADVVVAVSGSHLDQLRNAGVTADALRVIPNGVDSGHFRPDRRSDRPAILTRLGFESFREPILVGAAGNLRPVKGYDVLLEAASLALRRVPQLRFAIWGEGPARPALEAAVSRLGLAGRLVFPGRIPDPAASLAACDLFVQPSRSESFGLAAAEAMACGVPVIASAVGGLTDLIEDGITGLLTAPDSPAGLATSIAYLADDPGLRNRMGAAARERIVNRFTLETMVQSYKVLYENLMRGKCEP
jgi:glycosyltransferase involved in cell wall biosynthesis